MTESSNLENWTLSHDLHDITNTDITCQMSATKVTKACTKGCHNYRTFKQFNLLQRANQLTEHVTISRCPLHNGWTRRSESVSHLGRFTYCAVPLAFSRGFLTSCNQSSMCIECQQRLLMSRRYAISHLQYLVRHR